MKKAFIAGLITLFSLLCAHASEILLTEAKIWQIRASIEAQAEQIKRAQEIIENRTSVSKARIEEQLRIAEEDLIIQREKLEVFRDELSDQLQELERVAHELKTDWRSLLNDTLDKVRAQILENNSLIRRLRMLQERASLGDDVRWPENGSSGTGAACGTPGRGPQCSSTVPVPGRPGTSSSVTPTIGPALSVSDLQVELAKLESVGVSPGFDTPTPLVPPSVATPTG